MQMDLTGAAALVTGGGVGIGREIVMELARSGCRVALTYRSHDGNDVKRELAELGHDAAVFGVDLTDRGRHRSCRCRGRRGARGPYRHPRQQRRGSWRSRPR